MADIQIVSHQPQERHSRTQHHNASAVDEDCKYSSVKKHSSGGITIRRLFLYVVLLLGWAVSLFVLDQRWEARLSLLEQQLGQYRIATENSLRTQQQDLSTSVDQLRDELRKTKHSLEGTVDKLDEKLSNQVDQGQEYEKLSSALSKLKTSVSDLEDADVEQQDKTSKLIQSLKAETDDFKFFDYKTKYEQVLASVEELRKSQKNPPHFDTEQNLSPQDVSWAIQQQAKQETERRRLEQEQEQRVRQQYDQIARTQREARQQQDMARQAAHDHQNAATYSRFKKTITDVTDAMEGDEQISARREAVRASFKDGWDAYKKHAWGHDELKPQSKKPFDWTYRSHGLGLTILDSLDTLVLMNMTQDFIFALNWVEQGLDLNQPIRVSVFEATIRVVGGLLSAYELRGEQDGILLNRATELMNKLLFAYNTSSGIPHQTINLKTTQHWSPDWTGGAAVLSEFGSVQLELRTLSYHTKNPIYDEKATHLMNILEAKCKSDSYLCPTTIDIGQVAFRDDHVTFGALADSYYEYMLKQYLLTGKTERRYHDMALKALDSAITKLVRYSEPSRFTYLAEFVSGGLEHKMDELACFAGGMFALASSEIEDSGMQKTFLRTAEGLAKTCYTMFERTNTGLAPESVEFRPGKDFSSGQEYYLLRPETSETLFYMWRVTQDEKYRKWQWDIFLHLREYCHVQSGGFAGLRGVNIIPPEQDDQQQSFLLAETFKYMYLTFADDVLPLNEWVLNTEAHPLRIRHRDPLDVWVEWEDSHTGQLPWYPPLLQGVKVKDTLTPRMKKRSLDQNHRRPLTDPLAIDESPDDDARLREEAEQKEEEARHRAQQKGPGEEVQQARAERVAREKAQQRMKAVQDLEAQKKKLEDQVAAEKARRKAEEEESSSSGSPVVPVGDGHSRRPVPTDNDAANTNRSPPEDADETPKPSNRWENDKEKALNEKEGNGEGEGGQPSIEREP